MLGYHFTGDTLRDVQPIPARGEWLVYEGPIVPCVSGLHASGHPFDAMKYAPGCTLHQVELDGDLIPHGDPVDKWIGRRRKIRQSVNAEALLRDFARQCALDVVHLWDPPPIMLAFLWGDDAARDAARDAAWDAARGAAWGAGWDAARDAQRSRFEILTRRIFGEVERHRDG